MGHPRFEDNKSYLHAVVHQDSHYFVDTSAHKYVVDFPRSCKGDFQISTYSWDAVRRVDSGALSARVYPIEMLVALMGVFMMQTDVQELKTWMNATNDDDHAPLAFREYFSKKAQQKGMNQ